MRNKIKEIMNKEEGFTLVELLAVIVILGIIVAIAIPAVGSVINTAQDEANEAEQDLIVDAARLYFTTENIDEGEVGVQTLVLEGFLEPRGGEEADALPGGGVKKEETTEGEGDTGTGLYTYTFDSSIDDNAPTDG